MKNRGLVLLLVFFLIFLMLPGLVGAQSVDDPGCDPFDPDCPIDGGLSLLIAAGIGLGARKAYESRKKTVVISDNEG